MLKLSRYVLYDIFRSKVVIGYTLFLFLISMSLFNMEENSSKAMLSTRMLHHIRPRGAEAG